MANKTIQDLLVLHHKDAYLWALQCCLYNSDNAKDVLQIAYLKVLDNKAVFKNKSSFKTWLYSVIRFTAIDFYKKQPKYVVLEDNNYQVPAVDNKQDLNLKKYLEALPDRQRQVLLLAFYHDLTLEAISKVLDLHIGTVRTHYQRGKDSLREQLKAIAV